MRNPNRCSSSFARFFSPVLAENFSRRQLGDNDLPNSRVSARYHGRRRTGNSKLKVCHLGTAADIQLCRRGELMNKLERWWIALAGILLQMALGAVYAWSVFRVPLAKQFNWTISEVTLTFTIAIMVLGFASFFGGLWLRRVGPRVVAL